MRGDNTPDVLTDDVADLAVAMMLAQGRAMVGGGRLGAVGRLGGEGRLIRCSGGCRGRRAGVLGLGRIGMAVARRLVGFGMPIAYSSTGPKDVAADWRFVPDPVALAKESDVLFVTLAASAATRHIVGREVIAALGPEGLLVNVAGRRTSTRRRCSTRWRAARWAGRRSTCSRASRRSIRASRRWSNVLLQPHAGSGTVETRRAMGALVLDNLKAHFEGRPLLTPVL